MMGSDNGFSDDEIGFGAACSERDACPSVDAWASPEENTTSASSAGGVPGASVVAASDSGDTTMAHGTHEVISSCLWLSTPEVPTVVALAGEVAVLPTSLPRQCGIGITSGDV